MSSTGLEILVHSRQIASELMDDPNLAQADHLLALEGLSRLNRWSFGERGLWKNLCREAIRKRNYPLRVLDVATGSGDVPIRLARKAERAGLPILFSGCDISTTAIELARSATVSRHVTVDFFRLDVLQETLPQDFDVITTSLFLHHLAEQDAIKLLTKMAEAARMGILVNDLHRSRWNLALVTMGCHFLSRSAVVRFDGPASVRAAFTPLEALALARTAGIEGAVVETHFPCRWLLRWSKRV